MSGKGEYFLVRNIQSSLGAECFRLRRESAPTLLLWEVVLGSHGWGLGEGDGEGTVVMPAQVSGTRSRSGGWLFLAILIQ